MAKNAYIEVFLAIVIYGLDVPLFQKLNISLRIPYITSTKNALAASDVRMRCALHRDENF